MENKKIYTENLEKFERDVEIANERLKLAKCFSYMVSMWNNRDKFTFKSTLVADDTVELFNSKKFYSCGSFDLKGYSVKSYLERYVMHHNNESPNKKEISKLRRIVYMFEKLEKEDNNTFWIIAREFEHLIQF